MDKKLYDLMDWAGIEEIVYSEAANPHTLLGPHMTEDGLLIQAFIPTAASVTVKLGLGSKEYLMEKEDEAGFFAVLIPRKTVPAYTLLAVFDNGAEEEFGDPYSFEPLYTEGDLKKFAAGIHYGIYDKMGAHPMTMKGTEGVYFSVWAPCAMRVSVVGDFNLWDGRRHQMRRLEDSGIFELFIPGLKAGLLYKFEIKHSDGVPQLKSDPYGNYSELRPNNASVIWDIEKYQWNDKAWMEKRAKNNTKAQPVSIYEVHLGSWMRKKIELDENGGDITGSEFYNYREIAVKLADYVKNMGYTHVELLPVMEHPLDASWGYQVTGYYAPTSRYGTPDDFMFFMDHMHKEGIGVILDWVPAHFPRDSFGLARFDGTCVYEHQDPRQGAHPHWGTLIYNYGRPGVSNFLIANALFWADKYHADGIRMDAVASMLYLDYGKNPGEWVPNIYGGHENLEAVDFLKHLNSVFKGRKDGAVLIAEESTAWPKITADIKDEGLGFDYKWNMGWMNDFTGYMQCEPYFRKHHYGELTFSMLYAYSEDFILVFSHDEVVHGKGSMLGKMPGDTLEAKAANLKAAYGFMIGHPGKKLLFMGQDFAQIHEWNENANLDWNILEFPLHSSMRDYVKALNHMYTSQPALYQCDYDPAGFEWVECTNSQESIVVFLRKSKKAEETLLFVCNFDMVEHEKFLAGVPFEGKYKEILNSDDQAFGGEGRINPRIKASKKVEANERPDSIEITVAPMSILVFTCMPSAKKTVKDEAGKALRSKKTVKKTDSPKVTGKKKETEKPASKKEASAGKKTEPEAIKAKLERTTEKKPEAGKMTDKKPELEKPEIEKTADKKLENKKPEPEKIADKKPEQQKLENKKPEPEKIADKKPEQQKLENKKPEPERIADKKPEQQKLENKKPEPEKIADKKPEQQKLEDKKPEPEKIADKKPEQQKLENKKPEPEKIADKKPEQQLEDKKPEQHKPEHPGQEAQKNGNKQAGHPGEKKPVSGKKRKGPSRK